MSLIYINLVPTAEQDAFAAKVQTVATALGIENANWLMQIMKAESGLRPDIQNTSYPMSNGYATGLIQFTPDTAKGLGTSTNALKQMGRVEQMDWVYKYLKPYAGRINSYFDLYLIVFFPAAIGNTDNDEYVFETSRIARSSVARSNPTIDINKDGKITMAEFKQYLRNTVAKQYWDQVFGALVTEPVKFIKKNPIVIAVFAVIAMGITFAVLRITNK